MEKKLYTIPYTSKLRVSRVAEVEAESLEDAINKLYTEVVATKTVDELLETDIDIDYAHIEVLREPKF